MATVLIVDDRAVLRQRLSAAAASNGYQVVDLCSSGEEALIAFTRYRPDVVILDLHLPGELKGLETTRRLLEIRPDALVVACSGFGDPELMQEAFAAGAHRCLRKPFRMAELHRLFEHLDDELHAPTAPVA